MGGQLNRKPYPRRIKYEVGQKYFNYTILGPSQCIVTHKGRSYTTWQCLCNCGIIFVTTTKQIQKGVKKSCGCLSKIGRFKKFFEPSDVTLRKLFTQYRTRAKKFNRVWDVPYDTFRFLILSNCFYCDSPPKNISNAHSKSNKAYNNAFILTNGIDRVDNDRGYNLNNIVSCCRICNSAKSDLPVEDFREWLSRVVLKNVKN